ncbi:helix-turn-helix domain-containing protein [Rhizobium daejeonense]|uniref:Helix-turn-helix domain-containing protein n=1 Tax=Rhizobium daejeonense TaxID=240521 RepID=A0A6M1S6A5_9HYPH|nr:helix-turn-helix domain-containing protein [Rhizobium daejeonense]NGO66719.1 helix-turn-helix domain-containing protein [Rhizobium daejeonense]
MPGSSVRTSALATPIEIGSITDLNYRDGLPRSIGRTGSTRNYKAGKVLIADGDGSMIVGQVISGVVRITQALDDGRQQVVGLALKGEFFGCLFQNYNAFLYEAATDLTARVYAQSAVEATMARNHEVEHMIMMELLRDLEVSREWMMVLGCQNTLERVVSFMLHIRKRMKMAGLASDERIIEFPIGRRDIAGYLGTTVETISRHIQMLARQGIISIVDNSHFEILNLVRLQTLSKLHWKESLRKDARVSKAGGRVHHQPVAPEFILSTGLQHIGEVIAN